MTLVFGILAAVGILAVAAVIKSICFIEEGHAGVLTSFGKIQTDAQGNALVLSSGMHFKAPWKKLHEFSVMERLLSVRESEREVEILTRDGTLIRLDPQMRFSFDAQRMHAFLFGIKKPVSHLRELFRGLLSTEIGKFGNNESEEGSFAEVRKQRNVLNNNLNSLFQTDMGQKYGIQFKSVEIAEVLPPAELAQALNSVQKVEAENNTLLNRVRAECDQRISAAEHAVHIEGLRAQAVEKEINIMGSAIQQLQEDGILSSYLKRRRDEASSLSKTLYMKIH